MAAGRFLGLAKQHKKKKKGEGSCRLAVVWPSNCNIIGTFWLVLCISMDFTANGKEKNI